MTYYLAHEDRIVEHWERFDEYVIPVHDGGSSGITMRFGPWCGSKLPESRRDEVLSEQENKRRRLRLLHADAAEDQ